MKLGFTFGMATVKAEVSDRRLPLAPWFSVSVYDLMSKCPWLHLAPETYVQVFDVNLSVAGPLREISAFALRPGALNFLQILRLGPSLPGYCRDAYSACTPLLEASGQL